MNYAGGCQCGAIRYHAAGPLDRSVICYCRMCQKASGGPFMAFVRFPANQVTWSKQPAIFASSSVAERGFCPDCGTPLIYRRIGGDHVGVTLHSLDDPKAVTPEMAFSSESRMPWCVTLEALPPAPEALIAETTFLNNQHPDR